MTPPRSNNKAWMSGGKYTASVTCLNIRLMTIETNPRGSNWAHRLIFPDGRHTRLYGILLRKQPATSQNIGVAYHAFRGLLVAERSRSEGLYVNAWTPSKALLSRVDSNWCARARAAQCADSSSDSRSGSPLTGVTTVPSSPGASRVMATLPATIPAESSGLTCDLQTSMR
jgi:hypothetical protein